MLLAVPAFRWRRIQELLSPLVAAVKAVPVASFIILALVWLNSRQLSLFIAGLMVFPTVYTNVLIGIARPIQSSWRWHGFSGCRWHGR